ncbi:pseudouridine synthase [Streptomyces sp. Z26]|uniref:pseudouridine synthase n=1 Tax=Streptomyces sp. Z26 TaxID=2500177 RepID=UPI000EF141F6|nr:pseudouridine synthase [Streptomyces sp. Z26]RLL66139.1 rRNA pseudouridine synthase [Streptomyces sp. Z26]
MRSSGDNTGKSGGNRDSRGGGRQGARGGASRGSDGGKRAGTGRPRPEERRHEKSGRPTARPGGGRPTGGQGAGSGRTGGFRDTDGPGDSADRGSGGRSGSGAGSRAGSRTGSGSGGGKPGGKPGARTGAKAGQKPGPKTGPRAGAKPGGPKAGAGRPGSGKPSGPGASGGKAGGARTGGPRTVTGSGAPKARARRASAPARPREYEAQIEERNRERHSKPALKLPKTFGEEEGERLQKVLARAGMGSRRSCEDLIAQARVEVNGEIVREQGMRVDPAKDDIKVDGLTIATQSYLFFALNKPAGVVSAMEDPDGRQCLGDYVQNRETRLFHVGRLDTETEGIILLTNHGELAHRLTHPRYGVVKTYLAAIQGPIPRDLGKQLKDGIRLEDGYARADSFKVVENTGKNYLVEVALHEGRRHIVRRMLAEAGFPVDRLVRTRFGPIPLGDQKSGWLRRMTNTEVGMLMHEVGL